MKIYRKGPRYNIYNLYSKNTKLKFRGFKKRKWARISFNGSPNVSKALNFKAFNSLKKKAVKLIKRYFAATLTTRQFKKLFKLNRRNYNYLKTTYKQIVKAEYRLDTIVHRLFMLPDINIARELIRKKYFQINNKEVILPKLQLKAGDILSPSNTSSWMFLNKHLLIVIASLKKYYSRIFFKMSYPFVLKRSVNVLKDTPRILESRLTRRQLYFRYKQVKSNTISKTRPAKKYLFKPTSGEINKKVYLKKAKVFGFKASLVKPFKFNVIPKKQRRQVKLLTMFINLDKPRFRFKLKRKERVERKLEKANKIQLRNERKKLIQIILKRRKDLRKITRFTAKLKIGALNQIKKFSLKKGKLYGKRNTNKINKINKRNKTNKKAAYVQYKAFVLYKTKFKGIKIKTKVVKRSTPVAPKVKRTTVTPFYKILNLSLLKKTHYLLLSKKGIQVQSRLNTSKNGRRAAKKYKYWQVNRLTKRVVHQFSYKKLFNNQYKEYAQYKDLKHLSWTKTNNGWVKSKLLYSKKVKKLLSNNLKTAVLSKRTLATQTSIPKSTTTSKGQLKISRIKRKYLRVKGFYRKHDAFKVQVDINSLMPIYSPIEIEYSKINLGSKHKPVYSTLQYFGETNYNTLEFTII